MYDFNRQPIIALGGFTYQSICYYLPQSKNIQIIEKKSNHYENQRKIQINDMLEYIFKELYYYSINLQQINSKNQELKVISILFQNLKKIIAFNGDKYGIIPQQRLLYLVISFLKSKINKFNNLTQFLNEVHWLLIAPNIKKQQQLPFSFIALLNCQFEQLLEYVKNKFAPYITVGNFENLVDFLMYKITLKQSTNSDSNRNQRIYQKLKKQISNSQRTKQLLKLLKDSINRNLSINQFFDGQYELQLIMNILSGNQEIIELISKSSWAFYLNFYINYIEPSLNIKQLKIGYQKILNEFEVKRKSNNKNTQILLSLQQKFLINLIDLNSQIKTYSFHEIYQKTFQYFSPIFCHLIGILMFQCKIVDLFSTFNNKQYFQQISLHLLQSASQTNWICLVYMIGYFEHNLYFKQSSNIVNLWQSILYKYLPYDISHRYGKQLKNQIKDIQDKINDLNSIGLQYMTISYLNSVFKLQLNQKNSNNKLNQVILQLFFMNLQICDNNNSNQCMHLMKIFMKNYYKNYQFNYQMINCLQYLFEKKFNILDQKTISKIQNLFKLIYKIGQIYSQTTEENQIELTQKQTLCNQIEKFNLLFLNQTKKPLTLCVQLLKLAKYLIEKINTHQFELQNQSYLQMELQLPEIQGQQLNKNNKNLNELFKKFKINIIKYLKQWKNTPQQNFKYQKDAEQLLKYFQINLF